MADGCASVLDLGCGTGLFAASLTQCDVVGVDPAAAMLDIAARRPGGDRVQWIKGDARTVRLGRRFDLVVLTGHAFQVFLTDEDRAAVLRTIAAHLASTGRFIFDSRNPEFRQWRAWTPANSKRHVDHPALGRVLAWNDASCDPVDGHRDVWDLLQAGRRPSVFVAIEDRLPVAGTPRVADRRRGSHGRTMARRLVGHAILSGLTRDHSYRNVFSSSGPRASRSLMIMSERDARGPEEKTMSASRTGRSARRARSSRRGRRAARRRGRSSPARPRSRHRAGSTRRPARARG